MRNLFQTVRGVSFFSLTRNARNWMRSSRPTSATRGFVQLFRKYSTDVLYATCVFGFFVTFTSASQASAASNSDGPDSSGSVTLSPAFLLARSCSCLMRATLAASRPCRPTGVYAELKNSQRYWVNPWLSKTEEY